MDKRLAFKLCRFGKKRQPIYRIGILPTFRSPNKKYALDFIGYYNPRTKEFKVNEEKVKDYLARGTAMTDTIKGLFIKNNLLPKDSVATVATPPKKASKVSTKKADSKK